MREFFVTWTLLVCVICVVLGGGMVAVNIAQDDPVRIREAILGVGLLNAGFLLLGVLTIGGKLNDIREIEQENQKYLKFMASNLRRRDE